MIRKHHNYKLMTNPWHGEDEPLNIPETPGRQTEQTTEASLPHQENCKNKMDIIIMYNKT